MEKIYLFDFDGTITKKDTFPVFIKATKGIFKYYFSVLKFSPYIIKFLLKKITREKLKQIFFSYHYKGDSIESFNFLDVNAKINKIIRPKALQKIEELKKQNCKIFIVSASVDLWLRPWCRQHGFDLICTNAELKNNRFTGNFSTKNCWGPEKVRRIKEKFAQKKYYFIAFGDTRGDREMLSFADESFYRYFH